MAGGRDHRAVGQGALAMKHRLGQFVVDAIIANVIPTLIALWLHERNVRRT